MPRRFSSRLFRRLHLGLNRRFGFRICSACGKLTFQLLNDGLSELSLDGKDIL